jgi:hypothetical protein
MTLDELTRLLDRPKWLSKSSVDYSAMRIIAGWIPVGLEPGQTTVANDIKIPGSGVSIDHSLTLWIRMSGGCWYGGEATYLLRTGKCTSDKSRVVEAIAVSSLSF